MYPTRQAIENWVIDGIARQKGLKASAISSTSSLADLAVTSLDAITIVYDLEEQFDIEVPNEALDGLATVRDIVDRIEAMVRAKG